MNVSVVIPTLNEAAEIVGCIASARKAGASEIIVVDGGSNDQTPLLASDHADLIIHSSPGRAAQQNCGSDAATGECMLFLHADSRLAAGCIEQIIAAHATSRTKAFCGGFRQRIDAHGVRYRLLERGNAARIRWAGTAYGDQGIFVSRHWFSSVGGFPEWPIMEDVELMRRLASSRQRESGSPPILLPGPIQISPRRWEKNGIAQQTFRNWMMLTAWYCGASPEYLAKFYPPCPTVLSA